MVLCGEVGVMNDVEGFPIDVVSVSVEECKEEGRTPRTLYWITLKVLVSPRQCRRMAVLLRLR